MLFHLISITFLLVVFTYISYNSYEGFNTKYDQKKYSPNTDIYIPKTKDGTRYLSPDINGKCPGEFERDQSDVNSLCHTPCRVADAKFYVVNDEVIGCSVLDMNYGMKGGNYRIAKDEKTKIVSPQPDGSCPKNFKLDTKSGLCHIPCENSRHTFYGAFGCMLLNTDYPQTKYGTSDEPYPIAEDGVTRYVSPTSKIECPDDFLLDYENGVCHSVCPKGTFFDGKRSGLSIVGCN
jgi:hypothetical protein